MRIVVVYKDYSDHGREVREYIEDFERQTGLKVEVMDLILAGMSFSCELMM